MDAETLEALQALVGNEFGLPPTTHKRIAGDTLAALRADAQGLAQDLGLTEPAREPNGRSDAPSSDMNQRIRAAAGRST